MRTYQLGNGMLGEDQSIILHCGGLYLDLSASLARGLAKGTLELEGAPPASLTALIDTWPFWRERLPAIAEHALEQHERGALQALDPAGIRWLPPIMYPPKLICLGANYVAHNAEMGYNSRPPYPYCFLKPATTTLVGSGAEVALPELARMIDWEVELAVVIGERARHVRGDDAMGIIAGYSVLNDISARDWIVDRSFLGMDWVMLKSFDGFAPFGPLLTPAAFVADPQALMMTLSVNGQIKQRASTAGMAFSVREIVEHLASIMTLEPGDVIATGTPPGVGFGRKPQEFLKSGDLMIAAIEGLGELRTQMR